MNPDLLEQLRALLRTPSDATRTVAPVQPTVRPGAASAEASKRILPGTEDDQSADLTSATADSLFRITGVPDALGGFSVRGATGMYVPDMSVSRLRDQFRNVADSYSMDSDERDKWRRIFDASNHPDYLGYSGRPGMDYSGNERDKRIVLLHEGGHRSARFRDKPFAVDASGEQTREKEADVFANVFDFLSKTGTPSDTANWRSRFEGNSVASPSYATVRDSLAKMFLSHPSKVFRGHPLREEFGLKSEQRFTEVPNVYPGVQYRGNPFLKPK